MRVLVERNEKLYQMDSTDSRTLTSTVIGQIQKNGKRRSSQFNGRTAYPVVVDNKQYEIFSDWSARQI